MWQEARAPNCHMEVCKLHTYSPRGQYWTLADGAVRQGHYQLHHWAGRYAGESMAQSLLESAAVNFGAAADHVNLQVPHMHHSFLFYCGCCSCHPIVLASGEKPRAGPPLQTMIKDKNMGFQQISSSIVERAFHLEVKVFKVWPIIIPFTARASTSAKGVQGGCFPWLKSARPSSNLGRGEFSPGWRG